MIRLLMPLFSTLFLDWPTRRFLIGVGAGLAFSMAVILCSIGIMDGFDRQMRSRLRMVSGDLQILSRKGFVSSEEVNMDIMPLLSHYTDLSHSSLIQTEAFIIKEKYSKGILVRGISDIEYSLAMNQNLELKNNQIALGEELAKSLKVNIGDTVVIALATGEGQDNLLPKLNSFTVKQIVSHGIYEFDSRIAYLPLETLGEILGISNQINAIFISAKNKNSKELENIVNELKQDLPKDFSVKPFWSEFSVLLEAVQIEKTVLALALQVIVLISLFNVFGLFVYLHDKKAQEIFLFRAMGLSQKKLFYLWILFLIALWAASCLISILFVFIFNFLLQHLDLLALPGAIYHLGRLDIQLGIFEYLLVFIPAFVQIIILALIGLRKFIKRPVIAGLRMEFN